VAAAVIDNFRTEDVDGKLFTFVTDVRTNITTRFCASHHFLHVFRSNLLNFDGEGYGFLSNRGGDQYPPVIVSNRYEPLDVAHFWWSGAVRVLFTC
jgi:hypothetical protein